MGVPPSPSPTPVDVEGDVTILEQLDVGQYLVLKKAEDEGPDVRGGQPEALVIHATKAHKNGTSLPLC